MAPLNGVSQRSLFLMMAKRYVAENGVTFVPRSQSMEFLASRGMSVDDVTQMILCLSVDDFDDGPEPDRDPRYAGWTVAEFHPTLDGEMMYLKISVRSEARRCKCLSVKLWRERGAGS